MFNRKAVFVMALMVAATVAMTGCKSKPKGGIEGDGSGLTPIDNTKIEGLDTNAMSGERLPPEGDRNMFQPVMFEYDSSQVPTSERAKIEAVAQYLKGKASAAVVIEGNCDERGSAEYNLALGERRALAVRAYLVGLGVENERVQTKSLGEEQPVAMGHDEESWRQNRRGVFVIVNR